MKVICKKCKKEFNAKPFSLLRGRGKYCGMDCRRSAYKLYVPTKATKEKISIFFKGRVSVVKGKHWKLSEETKKKMREKKKGFRNPHWIGEKNPRWKGGVSKENKAKRQLDMETTEYRMWRREVFERDGYACVLCHDDKGGNLEADHIVPVATRPELMLDIENGRTLCTTCHKKITVEFNRQYWKNQFGQSENWVPMNYPQLDAYCAYRPLGT